MFSYCCRCGLHQDEHKDEHQDEEDLLLVELSSLGQAPHEVNSGKVAAVALKDSTGLPSSIVAAHDQGQPTTAAEWQPPPQHLAVFEADFNRKEAAMMLLEAFRQRVDLEILSAEPKPPLAAELPARHFCSDDTLLRHLMLCNGDEQRTLASLKATLKWRADFLESKRIVRVGEGFTSKKSCQFCAKDPNAHVFLRVGMDAAGQHVIYSCAGAASCKTAVDACRCMALELERIFDGNSVPGRVTWVVNMAGFGVAECDPRTVMLSLPMFFNHYPERFGHIVLWGMPTIFRGMWTLAQKIMDPITKARIHVLRTDAEHRSYAEAYWSNNAEMATWLDAAKRVKGVPGDFPDISLSRQLSDTDSRTRLERIAAVNTK